MNDATPVLRLLPESASNFATKMNWLMLYLLGVTGFFVVLILVLIVFFALYYRRRHPAEVPAVVPSPKSLEIGWMVAPLPLLLGMFFWGAFLFVDMRRPPADAEAINVQAKRWMWTTQHANGSRQKNELTVPLGRPVRLVMGSEDVIHSFFIPAFRTKQDVMPGRLTEQWFMATQLGEFELYCSEYCGADHSQMRGKVRVLTPTEYAAWLAGTAADEAPAVVGARLFQSEGCTTCHGQRAPTLFGVFGTPQRLTDGTDVIADESYLRESILLPAAKVVAGYSAGNMPSYRERLTEEQVQALIAYIKSIGPGASPTNTLPAASQPVAEPLPGGRP